MKKPLILPLLVLALPLVACGDVGPTVSISSSETETGGTVVTSSTTITSGTEASSSDIEAGGTATSSSSMDETGGEASSSTSIDEGGTASSSSSIVEGGGEESSSSSTSEPEPEPEPELAKTLTFDEAYGLLKTASEHEKTASKETRRQVDTTATDMSYSYLEEETLDIYDDGSAAATGTVTSFEDEEKVDSMDLLRRKALLTDKIYDAVDLVTRTYDLYYEVTDYSKDHFHGSVYSDEATRIFALNNPDPTLGSDGYILKEDIPQAVTYQHAARAASNISSWQADPYVAQTGIDTFALKEGEGEVGTYATTIEYEIEGDLNDTITYTYEMEFTLDFATGRLLDCLTTVSQVDVSNSDPDDVYTTIAEDGGAIEYGTRAALPSTAADPHDYFLQDVTDVAILDADREEVDPDSFPKESSLVFALPKDYEPSKALALDEWSLTPYGTSDDKVVAIDGGFFEVVGHGDVTLTWSYYGLEDGVWREKTVQKAIHINEFDDPTSIEIYGWNIPDTMVVGDTATTYVWVNPSSAKQEFEATSSNEDVMTVTADLEEGKITVTAVGAGEATITVTVPGTSLKDDVTVTVVAPAEMTAEEFLTSNYFVVDDEGTDSDITIKFYDDGTGYEKEITSGTTYEYNFEWSVDGREVTIDNWGPELNGGLDVYYEFFGGTISPNFDRLTLDMEGHDFDFVPVPLE